MDEGQVNDSTGTRFSCEDCTAFVEESQTVGFAIVDLQGVFICVNEAYCKSLNATWRQIVGTNYAEWTHPKDLGPDQAAAKELADGIAMRYGIFKTYIQHGSSEKHPREISGFLEVEAVWESNKCQRYRVRFTPYGQTDLLKTTSARALRDLLTLALKHWKAIAIALLTLVSIFGGSELVMNILSTVARLKDGIGSE